MDRSHLPRYLDSKTTTAASLNFLRLVTAWPPSRLLPTSSPSVEAGGRASPTPPIVSRWTQQKPSGWEGPWKEASLVKESEVQQRLKESERTSSTAQQHPSFWVEAIPGSWALRVLWTLNAAADFPTRALPSLEVTTVTTFLNTPSPARIGNRLTPGQRWERKEKDQAVQLHLTTYLLRAVSLTKVKSFPVLRSCGRRRKLLEEDKICQVQGVFSLCFLSACSGLKSWQSEEETELPSWKPVSSGKRRTTSGRKDLNLGRPDQPWERLWSRETLSALPIQVFNHNIVQQLRQLLLWWTLNRQVKWFCNGY